MAAAGSGLHTTKITMPTSLGPKVSPVVIPKSASSGGTGTHFNVVDNEKRWLVVGICLHKLLLPPLRDCVSSGLQKHYVALKSSHKIDAQNHKKHLDKDGSFKLNYGSINGNYTKHRKIAHRYNYNVKSEVELGKLFLEPHMAHFTGYDDTCDLSAVLGILSNAGVFGAVVQNNARDVRSKVRNDWGHCNFNDWDEAKFLYCFQLMETLTLSMGLTAAKEKLLITGLKDWEKRGLTLCMGSPVDKDLLKLIRTEVKNLEQHLDIVKKFGAGEFGLVKDKLKELTDEIDKANERITELEKNVKAAQRTQDKHESDLKDLRTEAKGAKEQIVEITSRTDAIELKEEKLIDDLESLQKSHEITIHRVNTLEEKNQIIEEKILKLENKKSQKVFKFQAPDRNSNFCGRIRELEALESRIEKNPNGCVVSSVCGLGGTGKTSLVLEHVWQLKEQFLGGVFWISGESATFFQTTLNDVARRIGTLKGDFSETLSETLLWLQSSEDRWCVVIDNLDELELSMEMRELLLGPWKREACGHLVVTTRRESREIAEDLGIEKDDCVELGSFPTEEGLQFMKRRTCKDSEDEDSSICELVNELGGLPLALEQAAAYVRSLRCSFADYLREYKKEKLALLNQKKARLPVQKTSNDRLAVITTWSLNFTYVSTLSEEYNLGCAASSLMEVSAFLNPDDIPYEIINEGIPQVEIDDLKDISKHDLGPTQILSLLTKFSLFYQNSCNSYSVHRLVQEVIRDRMERLKIPLVLQTALRMLHYSFEHTESPTEVCKNFKGDTVLKADCLPSLYLWGRLAANACVLYNHLSEYKAARTIENSTSLLFSEETLRVISEAAIYLSVCREKVRALEMQKRKLEVLANLENPPAERTLEIVKCIAIPLQNVEYKLISCCMEEKTVDLETVNVPQEVVTAGTQELKKSEELRTQGNDAVKEKKYREAMSLYCQAIELTGDDYRLYCNRALCHLKLDQAQLALEDCNICLTLSPLYSKALARKAWALHDISKNGSIELQSRALAAAAVAVYVDPSNLKSHQFSTMFPNLFTRVVKSSLHLAQLLYMSPNCVILLQEGKYLIEALQLGTKTQFVVVGLGTSATIEISKSFCVMGGTCYFENIHLPEGNSPLICQNSAEVILYNCDISGGYSACKDFPECNGGTGCVAESIGRTSCNREGNYGSAGDVSGVCGSAGIQIVDGTCYIDSCKVHHCGGGGVLSHGMKAHLHIRNSEIYCNSQAGLEAREGGHITSTNNDIYSNGFHGVLIGPNARSCRFAQNNLFENAREGVLCFNTTEEILFERNEIYHNAAFGFSLDNTYINIRSNRIFENGFYGVLAKSRTTAVVKDNEIFANKCGGIHIGVNFSGRITLDSNTVHDHGGPWLNFQDSSLPENLIPKEMIDELNSFFQLPKGETTFYSEPPILSNNKEFNNKERMFHPQERVNSLLQNECSFCHSTNIVNSVLRCRSCRYVLYCSKKCREKHWYKHMPLCSAITSHYCVTVKPVHVHAENKLCIRTFGSHLVGIGKGPKPNPKRSKRFVVKIQTQNLNSHPLQHLAVYDQSLFVDCEIQSPEIFHIIMECGVLGALHKFTSKKAFFWATFANKGKELTIFLDELAPYKLW